MTHSEESEEDPKFTASCKRVENAALRLIARAEQNSQGLTAKLISRGHDASVVRAVVFRLLEQGLLDDARYAELWLRSHLSGQSPRRLQISLKNRGINIEISREALEKALDPETEFALLLRFLKKSKILENEKSSILKAQLKYEGFSREVLERYFEA